MKHLASPHRFSRAFTLMELLIVLAIVALFSAVVLTHLNNSRSQSRDEKRLSDIEDIRGALKSFFETYGGYPAELSNQTLVETGFLIEIPKPPPGTGLIEYKYAPLNIGCTSYHLGALLENSNNPALSSDADVTDLQPAGTNCPRVHGSGATSTEEDFLGADPLFDVKP